MTSVFLGVFSGVMTLNKQVRFLPGLVATMIIEVTKGRVLNIP